MSSTSGPLPGDVFDVKKVRKFIELMNEHDLAEIDLRQGDQRIRLRRGPENVTFSAMPAAPSSSLSGGLGGQSSAGGKKATEPPADGGKTNFNRSPMGG